MPGKTPYSVHPSVAYAQAVLANLEDASGKSLETWLRLVREKGPTEPKRRQAWFQAQGLGANQAALLAERSDGEKASAFGDTEEAYFRAAAGYVERQYAGKKAPLWPLYEALLAAGLAAGSEAKACPCQTFVPLFRNHVFAQIKPSTLCRIDLGLALGDPKQVKGAPRRLLSTQGYAKRDRITHRMEVARLSDVDATLKRWLALAYQRDS
ncbi:MAG: DUF5655 domain-containing protein [Myxococcaceae bacterium]